MAEALELPGEGGRGIEVPESWLRAVMPMLEHEAYSIEVARHYRGHTWGSRRRTAPRKPADQAFIEGLRIVARSVGYDLHISVD